MSTSNGSQFLAPGQRQQLFLELASRPDGVTAQKVYEEALRLGDSVTVEAYHNLGRRLAHRGLLVAEKEDRLTVFRVGAHVDTQWLDEEQLASIVDPEYPLLALTVMKEARRQVTDVPESVWQEARERLKHADARQLFLRAIIAYSNDLLHAYEHYDHLHNAGDNNLPTLRNEIETGILLLKQMAKFGLGLSEEAIKIPSSFSTGLAEFRRGGMQLYDETKLAEELAKRIAPEPFIVEVPPSKPDANLLIAAVDGSTRGGLLTIEGEEGDFTVGHAPSVSINTAVAQTNRHVRSRNGRQHAAFLRLPEKPEDMQQHDNRYTIMARLFYPDLSESQYAHSIWNAMNLLEVRAALRVMNRWETAKDGVEVRPADVVLMDGPVTPQDRDSSHYVNSSTYGRIVRDLIGISWNILQKSRDDDQIVCGVVKNAQLRVFGPVINHFLVEVVAHDHKTQITAWPLNAMNSLSDQVLLTRILTAGRKKGDPWCRTCLVLRPFHAVTDFADRYSRAKQPSNELLRRADEAMSRRRKGVENPEDAFWCDDFRGKHDSYIQMFENAWYANFFLAAVPRLDQKQSLPRFEVLIPSQTKENGEFDSSVLERCSKLMEALKLDDFDVAKEHSMFDAKGWIDVLPSLLVQVHYTVKVWATELQARVQEYVGEHLIRYLKGKHRSIRIRPWKRAEIEAWLTQMTDERRRQAGGGDRNDQGRNILP
jgi:hypothetical protein